MEEKISLSLNLDELNSKRAENFFKLYAFETIIGDAPSKYYLGIKEPRICRFCKKTEEDATFKKEAHVMPQFMGNKNLLSYFECDPCNELFAKYEDSFANFFGATRTFAQIKGQTNKVPKFRDPKTGLEVFIKDTGIQISTYEGKGGFVLNEESKSLELVTERPGYVPIHAIKILIKMGLCMLKESDLKDYDMARRFIMQHEKDVHFKDSPMLRVMGYMIPGPPKFPTPFVQLFKKKDGVDVLCPTRMIVLSYANYVFQMIFPFAESDAHLQGKSVELPVLPLLIDNAHFEEFGQYQLLNLNLTDHVKKSGQEHKITFSFDSMKKEL